MTPARWQKIESLLQAALERKPGERETFLTEACAGDEDLRREVESLLASNEQIESFLQSPAIEDAAGLLDEQPNSMIGRVIGPYSILSQLGVGGMGEVYLAFDSRLDRKVALKFLPEHLSPENRVERFKREARAASALNHPNVATIYDIGETGGAIYIAMEYVEGQTLGARIARQPFNPAEIVDIVTQVAKALDEAHARGITHRDIKSDNIMLTERGDAKVLDFGLAKIRSSSSDDALSKFAAGQTAPGMVMGTVQYMSPEQALGRPLDHRTDIFSLGVVMYEMATGRLPFYGVTPSEMVDQILHSEPVSISIARPDYFAPPELERLIRKCLEKEPEWRYQSARALLIDLKDLKRDTDASVDTPTTVSDLPAGTGRRRGLCFGVRGAGRHLYYVWKPCGHAAEGRVLKSEAKRDAGAGDRRGGGRGSLIARLRKMVSRLGLARGRSRVYARYRVESGLCDSASVVQPLSRFNGSGG
jgi:eukaryotic-like serine/threonine-protein kinase